MRTINRRKKGYFLLAIIFVVAALSTSLAYIINETVSATNTTEHGTKVTLSVAIDDFSEQILIPQNAIATKENETKTLNITGKAALDKAATADDTVNATLSYKIFVGEDDKTELFNITDATESLTFTGTGPQDFKLKVALNVDEQLADGAVIRVEVTATLQNKK